MRVDLGVGCKGIDPEHVHTQTMGWHPRSFTLMLYLTWGAPLTVRGKPKRIFPGCLRGVRSSTPHGVAPSDGRCPVTGLPRTVLLVSLGVPARCSSE